MTAPITVLLVDDHSLVRRGFRRLLEDDPDIRVVGEAGDGAAAMAMVATLNPRVIVMDCAMPGTSGDHPDWIRRKSNFVRRFNRPSYVKMLQNEKAGTIGFAADYGVDDMEVAGHGGSFPIRIEGVGVIGAITVSGVPGRYDHRFVVRAICDHLGLDYAPIHLE